MATTAQVRRPRRGRKQQSASGRKQGVSVATPRKEAEPLVEERQALAAAETGNRFPRRRVLFAGSWPPAGARLNRGTAKAGAATPERETAESAAVGRQETGKEKENGNATTESPHPAAGL